MNELLRKAEVLIEALPYIRRFYGKTFVIKYGGAAQKEPRLKDAFAQDVVLLDYIGINTIVVHGGGPRISEIMEKMGKTPVFVDGHRFTDEETVDIVEMVLGGLVNKEIVSLISRHGGKAIGLTGKDGNLIMAKKKLLKKKTSEGEDLLDLGLVGEVTQINPEVLRSLDENGFIPVVAPVGASPDGLTLNINADYVASAIAAAMQAEKLILLTDVQGVLDKEGKIIPTLSAKEAKALMKKGVIKGGMIPKVETCIQAIKAGVGKTHIVDGRVPHCLLLEIFTEKGIGTEIVP